MHGPSREKQLTLIFFGLLLPATICMDTTTIEAILHENVTLKCRFDNAVDCAWQRNGHSLLVQFSNRYSLLNENDRKVCHLHIRNVSYIDNANWTCTAKGDDSSPEIYPKYAILVMVKNATTPETTAATTELPTTPQTSSKTLVETSPSTTTRAPRTTVSTDEREELPVAIIVASAASGGLLVLILAITVLACYRCKKPKNHVIPVPMNILDHANTFSGQYFNTSCNRHSVTPSAEYCDVNPYEEPTCRPLRDLHPMKNNPKNRDSESVGLYEEVF